jgi:hypothetical protein
LRTSLKSNSSSNRTTTQAKNNIDKFFITKPAYISIELNAHILTYLVLLVEQKQLPTQALLNLSLFSSLPCESIFRDARSLSGPFSTMMNFTANGFIRRSRKLAILNRLKYDQTESDLVFPLHHKHRNDDSSVSSDPIEEIGELDVKQVVLSAYNEAVEMIAETGILYGLEKFGILNLEELGRFIFDDLNKSSTVHHHFPETGNDADDDFESDEDGCTIQEDQDQSIDTISSSGDEESGSGIDEESWTSAKSDFGGIRIADNINPLLKESYFKIKINEKTKYLHKQSACWLLSNKTARLSSDRLPRVMQQSN